MVPLRMRAEIREPGSGFREPGFVGKQVSGIGPGTGFWNICFGSGIGSGKGFAAGFVNLSLFSNIF